MEHTDNSFLDENPENFNLLFQDQRADIHFLNEESDITLVGDDETVNTTNLAQDTLFTERYKGLEVVETFADDEEKRNLIEVFDPESLLDLQVIGINILKIITNEKLLQLSSLIPIKLQIHLQGLTQGLVLLIEPQLRDDGLIHLKFAPYTKHIPPILLTIRQKEAVTNRKPFFMFKRVVERVHSPLFEHKQNELWDTLTLTVSIKKKQFKELMEVIKFQPLEVEKWAQNQFCTEQQLEKMLSIIDLNFAMQLVFFTGMHCLFYPLDQLSKYPHLQTYVQKKLLELL